MGDATRKKRCWNYAAATDSAPGRGQVGKDDSEGGDVELIVDEPEHLEWKLLACETQGDRVWLRVVRAWHMPTLRISTGAVIRLGYEAEPNQLYAVRLCSPTGDLGDFLFCKECEYPGGCSTRSRDDDEDPRSELQATDVVVGTEDWDGLQELLRGIWDIPEEGEETVWMPLRKWHKRIVLQKGERMYLNLLQSGSEQRSRITAQAAAKLGRKDAGERRMHLVGVDGRDISILVNTVSVIDRVVTGGPLLTNRDQPDMILSEEDATHRLEDRGGPSQGLGQPGSEDQLGCPRDPRRAARRKTGGMGARQNPPGEGGTASLTPAPCSTRAYLIPWSGTGWRHEPA
jgi:hypothetical protein